MRFLVILCFVLGTLTIGVQSYSCSLHDPNCQCGIGNDATLKRFDTLNLNFGERSLAGLKTVDGDWPWTAQIVAGDKRCSGVIVNKEWVVTAATCIPCGTKASAIEVRFGAASIKNLIIANVVAIFKHPEFDVKTNENDLALLKLSKPLPRDLTVNKICIKHDESEFEERYGLVMTGFGDTFQQLRVFPETNDVAVTVEDFVLKHSLYMREVALLVQSTCNDTHTNELCVHNYHAAILPGDEGSPVMELVDGNHWELVGVASRSAYATIANDILTVESTGKVTRIAPYCSWMQQITAGAVCNY